jgi:hypothetical protein
MIFGPVAAPALAAPTPQVFDVPDGMEFDPTTGRLRSDLLEEDAEVSAEQGHSYTVTLGRGYAQHRLASTIETLAKVFPDSFAGLHWGSGVDLVAQFKGGSPAGALAVIDAVGVPYVVRDVAHSQAELERAADAVRDGLAAFDPNDVAVGVEPLTQSIVVTVNPVGSPATQGADVLSEALSSRLGVTVNVDFTDRQVFVPFNTYGGAELRNGILNFECTTGFTVYTSGGLTGVASAGHCKDLLQEPQGLYLDPFTQANHDITLKLSHQGSWGDMAYWTTAGTEYDDFYYGNPVDPSIRRDVQAVKSSFSVGDPIEWYGRKTRHQESDYVGWPIISAGGLSHLFCAIGGNAQNHDSGGPVFWGSDAAGFITGGVFLNGEERICFSRAMYIDEALGTTFIKTT